MRCIDYTKVLPFHYSWWQTIIKGLVTSLSWWRSYQRSCHYTIPGDKQLSQVLPFHYSWGDKQLSKVLPFHYSWWLSSLMLWVRISIRAMCTTLCDKVCQWLATDRWFSPGPPVSSTNKIDRHDISEILLKVTLNTIKPNQAFILWIFFSMSQKIQRLCHVAMFIDITWHK